MLTTERLLLRNYTLADAPAMHRLIGAREVAQNTLRIPHPYPFEEAERWIASHDALRANGEHVFAVVIRATEDLAGTVGLHVKADHNHAELGYWIGVPYWGLGYATEAAGAVVRFGFESLSLNRIFACHFVRNPASGRVLRKLGMQHEGTMRQHVRKWDEYVDLEYYAILHQDYIRRAETAAGDGR